MVERKLFTKKLLTPVNVEDVIPCEHVVLKSGSRWQGFNLSLHHHPPYEFDTVCFNVHILTLSVGGMTRLWQYKDGRTHQGTYIRGDFTFNPAGVPSSMRWDSDVEILNIVIDPWFIQKIADESSAANSDRLELVPVFQARDPHVEHITKATSPSTFANSQVSLPKPIGKLTGITPKAIARGKSHAKAEAPCC